MSDDDFREVDAPPARGSVLGDNRPPSGLPWGDELKLHLEGKHGPLFARAKALIAAVDRAPKDEHGNVICPDESWERKFVETIKQIQACEKELDAQRTSECAPYDAARGIVHGLFREVQDSLVDPTPPGKRRTASSAVKERLAAAVTRWQTAKAEEARRKLEEEARRRREAEQAEARRRAEAEAAARAATEEAERQRRAAERARLEAEEAQRAAERKRNEESRRKADEAAKVAAEQARRAEAASRVEAAKREAAEREAVEAREREAKAAEERASAEGAASVKSADLTRMRSDSAVSSLREFIDFRDPVREMLNLEVMRDHLPADAIDKAIRSYMRANSDLIKEELKNGRQPLRGVVFFMNHGTAVR